MIQSFDMFNEGIKFIKTPKKKGSKTDTFNVKKEDTIVGQIKWSSRLRGYAFLPTLDCDQEVKSFIKDLMDKRRKSKKVKVNEDYHQDSIEVDEIVDNIKDICLDLNDIGFNTQVINSDPPRLKDCSIKSISDKYKDIDDSDFITISFGKISSFSQYKPELLIEYNEISDTVDRVNRYLNTEGWSVSGAILNMTYFKIPTSPESSIFPRTDIKYYEDVKSIPEGKNVWIYVYFNKNKLV